jgi:DNA-binding TFAR19-related protein (PDSD5 family)
MPEKDEDLELLKSKKMLESWSKIAIDRKMKMSNEQQKIQERNDRELVLSYLYDMGEDVLALAESQFPVQTKKLIKRIAQLIKEGKVKEKIPGGVLLDLFRYAGMNLKIKTSIKIEDHGKMLSFSEKLRNEYEDTENPS